MPGGPVIHTGHGRRCALCNTRDPSPGHLAEHNISLCIGNSKRPLKKSRKGDMMRHLALHGIFRPASAVLAEKWRFDLNKKAYSCGFCVVVFSTITERSNHIDNEHWRCGQTMSAWDLSTTVRGLLLQAEVRDAWQGVLRSNPYVVESSLRWRLPKADGLQLRLEMSEESAAVLARATLELSSSEFDVPNQEALTSMTRSEGMEVDPSYPAARQLVTKASTAQPSSIHNPETSMFRPGAWSSRVRPGSSPWNNLNTSIPALQTTQRIQNPLASFTDLVESAYPWNQLEPLSSSFLDCGDSETDLQSSSCPLPADWPPLNLGLPPDDHARIQNYLSESGASLAAQISYPRHGQSSIHGKPDLSTSNSNTRIGLGHPIPGQTSPSTSVDGWSMQLSNQEHRSHPREKPLPNLPSETGRSAELRPKSPMDLDIV